MKNALTWFEIPVSNMMKAKPFYETVLQCKLSDMVIEHVKLAIFPATEVSGALIEETDYQAPEKAPVIYLNIPDSIEQVLARAQQQGGKIVTPRTLIQEDVGWSAAFRDLDGNLVGLYESVPES